MPSKAPTAADGSSCESQGQLRHDAKPDDEFVLRCAGFPRSPVVAFEVHRASPRCGALPPRHSPAWSGNGQITEYYDRMATWEPAFEESLPLQPRIGRPVHPIRTNHRCGMLGFDRVSLCAFPRRGARRGARQDDLAVQADKSRFALSSTS